MVKAEHLKIYVKEIQERKEKDITQPFEQSHIMFPWSFENCYCDSKVYILKCLYPPNLLYFLYVTTTTKRH